MVETKLEKHLYAETMKANSAFVAAMNLQIKRGREKVKVGTYVDTSPPINAVRIRGDVIFSACGSPSAMCLEVGSHDGGAQTLK